METGDEAGAIDKGCSSESHRVPLLFVPLILTSNRALAERYSLFPQPVVAESLLDRLINTSHQILMDGPSYRPRKRPGRAIS